MNELNIKISNVVSEAEIILERIYVLSNDLDQEYFEQDINGKEDIWKIDGERYKHAGVKANMIPDMAYKAQNKLREIQEML